jgi:RNA polymerase sigma-70 factor (ECF subfamily)
MFAKFTRADIERVLVNGVAGLLARKDGRPASLLAVTVVDGRIVEIDVLADPERLARLVD